VTEPTASKRIVVDSSGWLEFITKDTKAESFLPYFTGGHTIIIPALVLYEVRKVLLLRSTSILVEWFASEAMRHEIVDVDKDIAFDAAALSVQSQLPMADAIIYTTAARTHAELLTSDSHFSSLPGVILV
jgi:predicted nucleic acid-binding protein